ncbi:HNH endonuclease [bacterium]|nr:HNH endonuclease [bacterium]
MLVGSIALNENVLVLNRLWQAVNICTARRAICLLYQEHAEAVLQENGSFRTLAFEDWRDFSRGADGPFKFVHGVNYRIAVPPIVILAFYDKTPHKEVKFTRENIYHRDKNTCQYCGKSVDRRDLNLDHVIPRDFGGKTTWENIVCSCKECNTRKANRTPQQAGLTLIRNPKKPVWRPYLDFNLDRIPHEVWKHFIDIGYWKVEMGEEEDSDGVRLMKRRPSPRRRKRSIYTGR